MKEWASDSQSGQLKNFLPSGPKPKLLWVTASRYYKSPFQTFININKNTQEIWGFYCAEDVGDIILA
jgi:hypothetical protein